jgi:hypothetical protein
MTPMKDGHRMYKRRAYHCAARVPTVTGITVCTAKREGMRNSRRESPVGVPSLERVAAPMCARFP